MSIRLILSDLDGTLLSPDRQISDQAVQAIRRLQERGIGFSFVTGRPLCAAQRFIDRAELSEPVILCNGALIWQAGRVLVRHSAPLAPARSLMERADQLGWTVLFYSGLVEYAMRATPWVEERRRGGREYPVRIPTEKEWAELTAEKINLFADGKEAAYDELKPLMEAAREHYSLVSYQRQGMELTAANVNKASALRELSHMLHIPLAQMLAIGDAENDLEMLRLAGVGVAVGNAAESVKHCADYVCIGCYTQGVLEAMERFCPEE